MSMDIIDQMYERVLNENVTPEELQQMTITEAMDLMRGDDPWPEDADGFCVLNCVIAKMELAEEED